MLVGYLPAVWRFSGLGLLQVTGRLCRMVVGVSLVCCACGCGYKSGISYSPGRIHAVAVLANRTMVRAIVAVVAETWLSTTRADPKVATTTVDTASMPSRLSFISACR